MKRLPPLPPGDLLREEFLAPFKLTPAHWQRFVVCPGAASSAQSARKWGSPPIRGLRLAKVFGNSVEFWLNRHTSYDIETARPTIDKGLEKIEPLKAA
jgi:plasmid maintenance system antidote protein VapI